MPNFFSEEIRSEIASILREVLLEDLTARNDHADEPLLTAEELADRLRVALSWVYEASRRGDLPTVRIGRYIRFRLSAVLAGQAPNQVKKVGSRDK
jgi:excisionase family DNA binding protein